MIKGLNTYRFFAFLAVFLTHATTILYIGYLGVVAFFVLSGFLITPILVKMKANHISSYFYKFYGRRFVRIFPLYYFYLAIIAIILLIAGSQYEDHYFAQVRYAVLYIYNFFHASSGYIPNVYLTHFWSLAVEEQFYIIWPVVIFFTAFRNLKKVLIITIIVSVICRVLFLFFITHKQFQFLNPYPIVVIYVLPTSHFDAFAIGGFFALFMKNQKIAITGILVALFFVIGIATERMATGHFDWSGLGYPGFMSDSYKAIWGYTFASLIFAFILLNIRQGIFFPRIFNNRILEYLGKISYGLYIYHFPIIYFVHLYALPKSVYTPLALGLTIGISALSFEFFEKKILLLKDKYFSVSPPEPAPVKI